MNGFKTTLALATAGLAASLAFTSFAEAKSRHRKLIYAAYHDTRPTLMVNRRSFLDPGPVVPVGSLSSYVTANTVFNRTPDQIYAPSQFGNASLPQPLELPGRPGPIVEFWTPGYKY